MPPDIEALRAAAETTGGYSWELVAADEHHGPYVVGEWGGDVCDFYAMSNPAVASIRNGGTSRPVPFTHADENAAFVALANPATILALLAERDRLLAENADLRAELKSLNEGAAHNAALDRDEIQYWKDRSNGN